MSVVLVCAALAGFALLYSLWVPRDDVHVPQPPSELDHLREKRKVVYDNLKDLNFEYRTGKLSDADYQSLKTSLQYDLALLMKRMDELEKKTLRPAPAPKPEPREAGICAACGHVNAAGHKHCSECGAKIAAVLAALIFVFTAVPALAQLAGVQGVVQNGTTGKPVAGAAVTVVKAGAGHDTLGTTKTDAQGRFRFDGVETPTPPEVLMVQAEYGGIRYTTPVTGAGPVELNVYDAGAAASAISGFDRALILQPSRGRLIVNELYIVRNTSSPPAVYASSEPTLRFYVPEAGRQSVQVNVVGASGMAVPVEATSLSSAAGVFGVSHALKPGETRFEVSYQLEYPGTAELEGRAVDKVERTRLAVPPGVDVRGQGVRLAATEPQMKFGIYEIASNDRWNVKLSGEATAAAAAGSTERGGSDITKMDGTVEARLYWVLAAVLIALASGFVTLWRYDRPVKAAAGLHPTTRKRGAS